MPKSVLIRHVWGDHEWTLLVVARFSGVRGRAYAFHSVSVVQPPENVLADRGRCRRYLRPYMRVHACAVAVSQASVHDRVRFSRDTVRMPSLDLRLMCGSGYNFRPSALLPAVE